MDSTLNLKPDYQKFSDIISCIEQKIRDTKKFPKTFFVISVWFPDVANKYLKSNTPDDGFCIIYKLEENYTMQDIVDHAKKIWEAGFIPVEIVQNTGGVFYATPRLPILQKTGEEIALIDAEYDIPTLDDFYV